MPVSLRPASAADHDWLLALMRDARIARALAMRPDERLERSLALDGDAGGVLVVEDDAGARVGMITWETINVRSRIATVHSLAIHPDHAGRGLATSAVRAVTRHLVRDRGFHRVESSAYGFNTAARRVFRAAGFTEEGVLRRAYDRHGGWQDGILFGILDDEL